MGWGGPARRMLLMVPTFLGITLVTFAVVDLAASALDEPGQGEQLGLGARLSDDDRRRVRETLRLDGTETIDVEGVAGGITPGMSVTCRIHRADGSAEEIALHCRIDTADEVEYYRHGGILHYVLRELAKAA